MNNNLHPNNNNVPPSYKNNVPPTYNNVPPTNKTFQPLNNNNILQPNKYVPPINTTTNSFKKPVNKIIYCFLAFLLGGFGAHKFYAEKKTEGIFYLAFFWTIIPFFMGLYDFGMAITKEADAEGNIFV